MVRLRADGELVVSAPGTSPTRIVALRPSALAPPARGPPSSWMGPFTPRIARTDFRHQIKTQTPIRLEIVPKIGPRGFRNPDRKAYESGGAKTAR